MNKVIFALGLVAVLSANVSVAAVFAGSNTEISVLDKDKDKKKKKKGCSTEKKGCCEGEKKKCDTKSEEQPK